MVELARSTVYETFMDPGFGNFYGHWGCRGGGYLGGGLVRSSPQWKIKFWSGPGATVTSWATIKVAWW